MWCNGLVDGVNVRSLIVGGCDAVCWPGGGGSTAGGVHVLLLLLLLLITVVLFLMLGRLKVQLALLLTLRLSGISGGGSELVMLLLLLLLRLDVFVVDCRLENPVHLG